MATRHLSGSEMLTVAMNIESNGYGFYDEAAGAAGRRETREIFERLRDEEAEHLATFKEMKASMGDSAGVEYFGIDGDMASYLGTLVETGIFKKPGRAAVRRLDEVKALEMAVAAEKDSVLFYDEALASSVNPEAKKAITEIIGVEKRHIITLANRLRVARRLF